MTASSRARQIATLKRWRSKTKLVPRGASAGFDAAVEKKATYAFTALELVNGPDLDVSKSAFGKNPTDAPHLRVVPALQRTRRSTDEAG